MRMPAPPLGSAGQGGIRGRFSCGLPPRRTKIRFDGWERRCLHEVEGDDPALSDAA